MENTNYSTFFICSFYFKIVIHVVTYSLCSCNFFPKVNLLSNVSYIQKLYIYISQNSICVCEKYMTVSPLVLILVKQAVNKPRKTELSIVKCSWPEKVFFRDSHQIDVLSLRRLDIKFLLLGTYF